MPGWTLFQQTKILNTARMEQHATELYPQEHTAQVSVAGLGVCLRLNLGSKKRACLCYVVQTVKPLCCCGDKTVVAQSHWGYSPSAR